MELGHGSTPLATVPTTVISATYAPAGKQIMEMSIDTSDWPDAIRANRPVV